MTAPTQSDEATARSVRLLRTKLFIPRPHPDIIPRPHLIQKLDDGLRCKLTVISAPAGSGKSTLLSAWVKSCAERTSEPGVRFAWVSLDERDNDPARFWAYLVAALQTIRPEIGVTTQSMLQAIQTPPVENLLTELINDLTAPDGDGAATELVLILDDYHSLTAQPVHDGLFFLLENLPRPVHLVISSRSEPSLPLPHYRVRRELVELHSEDLRFTRAEAAAFLNQVMGLDLTAGDIEALDRLTEGWVAGLQLAALSMQGAEDLSTFFQSFGGSHRFVFDYLAQEVLNRQPEAVRHFLMWTSILERLSAGVCDAVIGDWEIGRSVTGDQSTNLPTGPYTSKTTLEYLETANLFLVPLDSQRTWYRYHHLFSTFLRARLAAELGRREVAELHRRASHWFEQQGLIAEAVSHAFQSEDYELAARIIQAASQGMFLRSQLTTLVSWLKRLPADLIRTQPKLGMIFAWSLLATAETETVEGHLQEIERGLGVVADGSAESLARAAELGGIMAEVTGIRASLAFNQMDLKRVMELIRLARIYLEASNGEGLFNRGESLKSVIWFNQAVACEFLGRIPEAIEAFTETIRLTGDDPHLHPMSLSHLAQLQISQGKLRQAEETYRQAQEWLQRSGRVSPLAAVVYTGLGNIQCEWNQLDAARRSLERGIEIARPWNLWEGLLTGYFGLIRLLAAQGDLPGARATLAELRDLAKRLNHTLVLPALQAQEARLAAQQGDLEAAGHWSQAFALPPEGEVPFWTENEAVVLAHVFICERKYKQAAALAGRLLQAAERDQRQGRSIEVLVIQAVAWSLSGEVAMALAALRKALALAEPEGYVRIFLDEGEPMRALIARLASQPPDAPPAAYLHRLREAFGLPTAGTPSPAPPVEKARLPEQGLSVRELEVLRLLSQGLTNQEIANRLVISLNTVKSHVKNILAHLEVANRTQATARARELGLI